MKTHKKQRLSYSHKTKRKARKTSKSKDSDVGHIIKRYPISDFYDGKRKLLWVHDYDLFVNVFVKMNYTISSEFIYAIHPQLHDSFMSIYKQLSK